MKHFYSIFSCLFHIIIQGIYIEEESYPISSNNDIKPKTVKVRRLLLSMESLPYWPEDSDIIRPIPANIVTDRVEIKQEKDKILVIHL